MSHQLNPASAVRILVEGAAVAHAAGYRLKTVRGCEALHPYGAAGPVALLCSPAQYVLELEQILWEKKAVDYYTKSNFSVEIHENGKVIRYTACQWTVIEEQDKNGLLWQRAALMALQRTEAADE